MRYFQKCPRCGGEAFEFKQKPVSDTILKSADVIHSDNPKAGDEITCQLCKAKIKEMYLNRLMLIAHD